MKINNIGIALAICNFFNENNIDAPEGLGFPIMEIVIQQQKLGVKSSDIAISLDEFLNNIYVQKLGTQIMCLIQKLQNNESQGGESTRIRRYENQNLHGDDSSLYR